jgi:uncharacterized protein YceK
MRLQKVLIIGLLANLGGCASIITGDSENVSVTTTPVADAKCELSNNRGTWSVDTPGTVNIKRSMSDLKIACKSKQGHTGSRIIGTSIKSTAAGNLLFGGVIGGAVDSVTGAAFDYPDTIEVAMK